jgi:sugar/nucleoside kinase (ribokinase family)
MTYDIYGLGNALVDTEYHVSDQLLEDLGIEKGMMTLIDSDQLNQLEKRLLKEAELKKQASGGSAANTLIALANFGASVFYSCKVANDPLGDFYQSDLIDSGVFTNLDEIREEGATGRCMVMVSDDAERTMNTFLGITGDLSVNEIDEVALAGSKTLYIEGYLASSDKARAAAIRAHEIARSKGISVALTFSDPAMVTYFKNEVAEIIGEGVDLLFCNAQEAMTWTNETTIDAALDRLTETASKWVCTLGKSGAIVFDGAKRSRVRGKSVDAVDTNGAGDMFAGAFLFGIRQGWSFEQSARFAVHASGHLVTKYGPRLPLAEHGILLTEFKKMSQG